MEKYDKRIDAYIAKAADFAQPILKHIRKLAHLAYPEINETIKWGFPHFDHKGTVCSMAAFKNHCAFGFWKGTLLNDPNSLLSKNKEAAMGQMGRITSISDLPDDDTLIEYIRNAVKLNEEGIKLPSKKPVAPKTETAIPDYFAEALNKHPDAKDNFERFSYSHRKEYIQWIAEAKTEETRNKRMITAIEWLSEGKSRNWKYERK
jgi:uncharacterized protein YdeI (YjbR/CyaY-like superfamily)